MEVRVHQAHGVEIPALPQSNATETKRKRLAVYVVHEDRPVVEPVGGEVVDGPWEE